MELVISQTKLSKFISFSFMNNSELKALIYEHMQLTYIQSINLQSDLVWTMDEVIDLTIDDEVIDLTMDDVTPREERVQRRADESGTVTRRVRLREDVSNDLFFDTIYSLSVSRFRFFQCSGTDLRLS